MKTFIENIRRLFVFVLPPIITVGLIILVWMLVGANQPLIFFGSNVPLTPTLSSATSTDPIQVIESISRQSIEASNRTLQLVQWLVPIFVLSFVGIATNIVTSFSKEIRESTIKLEEMGRKFELMSHEFEKTHKQLETITNNYLNLQQDFVSVESQTLPFDLATKAYENGRIDQQKYIESQAWYSWQKWKFGGDETGYEELLVHKRAQNGLPKSIIRSAVAELIDLNSKINTVGAAIDQDYKNRSRLLKVLNLPET